MNQEPIFRRTRIAPTPSGFLHLGNVLSFAITAALARRTGAKILLRIDDLDRERVNEAYVQDIFDTLQFMEIPWDEGPRNYEEYEREYSQLHRMNGYRQALQELKDKGLVFACDCSRTKIAALSADGGYPGACRHKDIPLDAKDVSWRLFTTPGEELTVTTWPAGSIRAALPPSMNEFVVRKKDGFPAYQLTSLLDDLHYGVDLIVRGQDLWPSTLAQLYLAHMLHRQSFADTAFYHHPLLLGSADRKLSKSAGSTSIQFLRKDGRKPADIYAMIAAMLGVSKPVRHFEELTAATGWHVL